MCLYRIRAFDGSVMSGVYPRCRRGTLHIFHSGEDLFAAVYVDGNFDDESAKVEGCFKVRHT